MAGAASAGRGHPPSKPPFCWEVMWNQRSHLNDGRPNVEFFRPHDFHVWANRDQDGLNVKANGRNIHAIDFDLDQGWLRTTRLGA